MRRPEARLVLSAALLLLGLSSGPAEGAERRFAVIIGYNGSDDPELPVLRYADDDAVRYGELLGHVAERVVVLTELDEDSRALWKDAPVSGAPTLDAVVAAVRETRAAMEVARAAGDTPLLYFIYSGHGNYDAEGRGYVHLADGRFTTRDLFQHVIVPSGRDPVVLIVDACNASFLVRSRGALPERRPAGPTTLRVEDYPNVGVVLASSAVGETHEWGRYLAGIFSHEVRSGLLGAADTDGDAAVSFAELAAFVEAANARVTNPSVRITPYIRPPLDAPNLALIDLETAHFRARLRLGAELEGKAYLVDGNLVRYADFHKTAEQSFWLALPGLGPFVLVRGDDEFLVPAEARGDLELDDLTLRQRTFVSARGAGSAYFDRTLFQEPFGLQGAERYLLSEYVGDLEVSRLVQRQWYENAGAWALVGGGLAALAAGGGLMARAAAAGDDAAATHWGDERQRYNDIIEGSQLGAGVLFGAGAAALAGSALWFALDRPTRTERYLPPLEVGVGPSGVVLTVRR